MLLPSSPLKAWGKEPRTGAEERICEKKISNMKNFLYLSGSYGGCYTLTNYTSNHSSTTMKRIIALGLALLATATVSLQAATDRVIQYAQLPQAAKAFIANNFGGRTAVLVKQDREPAGTTYEVHLSDGTEIDFNAAGRWKDVDGKSKTLPTGFIPGAIVRVAKQRHAGDPIVYIEQSRRGYVVILASGTEIYVNPQLKVFRYNL